MPPFEPQRFGNYVLTAHLGRGGMADVFRAQRTGAAGFERTAVVKRILAPYNDDQNFVDMFINEAKIAAHLTHPNIAHVYELGEVDGEYFMAMEYIKGKDLLHVLRYVARKNPERRHLPPEVAAYIARESCRGLAHAHEHADEQGRPQPIVHRDVSPQNIMIAYDGQVKIVDFGIAKAMFVAREETRSGTLKGKIAYMAPEQVSGGHPGPESDVFSVGVVLYEMLIGRRLFKGENDYDTLQRVKSMPVPEPSRVANWVPPELDRVVMLALDRDRQRRYKRAGSMARDLDEYLQQVRFSVEHMQEWMAATFPPEAREEVPDGHSAQRTPSSMRSPSAPRDGTNPGSVRARDKGTSRSGVSPQPIKRRTILLVASVAALVGVGGAVAAMGLLRERPEPVTERVVIPVPAAAEPAAAPIDLGRAPAAAAISDEPPLPPPIPLPVDRHDHHASPTGASSGKHAPGQKGGRPKIEMFDDSEHPSQPRPSAKPKIETFDD